jgi:hypothetical protein
MKSFIRSVGTVYRYISVNWADNFIEDEAFILLPETKQYCASLLPEVLSNTVQVYFRKY